MINVPVLEQIYKAPFEWFEGLGEVREVMGRKHIFVDNGANVLAVAHLDFVMEDPIIHDLMLPKRRILRNAKHDDRMGAYLLTYDLPLRGLEYDLLLTTDEEIGRSTGGDFSPPKDYNWMFMFDRRGSGCVTYMYKDATWLAALKKDFTIENGSGSCISKMEHLGCSAVNVGTAYHDEHSDMCYVDVDELEEQLIKFVSFYGTNKDVYFKHEKYVAPVRSTSTTFYYNESWRGRFWDDEIDVVTIPPKKEIAPLPTEPSGWNIDEYFDGIEYWGKPKPTNCKFCKADLTPDTLGELYIGICFECSNTTTECEDCGVYIQIDESVYDDPSYNGEKLTWLCPSCYKDSP